MGSRLGRGRPNRPLVRHQYIPTAINYAQNIGDSVGILDAETSISGFVRALINTIQSLDIRSQQSSVTRSILDDITFPDEVVFTTLFKSLQDVISISDSQFNLHEIEVILDDIIELSDYIPASKGRHIGLALIVARESDKDILIRAFETELSENPDLLRVNPYRASEVNIVNDHDDFIILVRPPE